jgi:hypothetical protein
MPFIRGCLYSLLQTTCSKTVEKYKPYIRLCPWPTVRIKYLGACWDSPLRQGFHSTLHRTAQTQEEMRLAKNEYQKIRDQAATAQQKKARSERKKRRYRLSANERRKQLRRDESAEDKEKRLQRRYQEPKYKGTIFMKRALAPCYHCGERAHNIRKCPQIANDMWNKSRCSQCRQPDHNVLSCKATKQPLDTVPALWIELTAGADVVVDWGGGSGRMDELCMERDGRFFARWIGYVADWLGWRRHKGELALRDESETSLKAAPLQAKRGAKPRQAAHL